jgi:hypothetical protein
VDGLLHYLTHQADWIVGCSVKTKTKPKLSTKVKHTNKQSHFFLYMYILNSQIAAGRSYGGVAANSAEYTHFANLFNQFRCQTMRGIEMMLSWTGSHIIEMINSGPNGRFEHILFLDPAEYVGRIQQKCLELEARFVGLGNFCVVNVKIGLV